jgi:hypothetical protein
MLPGKTAEKNGRVVALQRGERQLNRLMEVADFAMLDSRLFLQALALFFEALANQRFRGENLDQVAICLRALNGCNSAHDHSILVKLRWNAFLKRTDYWPAFPL